MAALGDEVLDGYVFPACAPCSYPYPNPAATKGRGAAGGSWQHRGGGCLPASSSSSPFSAGAASSPFPGCRQLTAAEYFDSYQRAQLMALLAQVGPGLGLRARARRLGSCDVAVQVSPRVDAAVQCSLGRRTLQRRARDPQSPAGSGAGGTTGGGSPSQPPARRGPEQGSPLSCAQRPVRFPRTVAVYSPVASRRVTAFLRGPGPRAAAWEQRSGASDGEQGSPPVRLRGPEEGEGSASKVPRRPQSEDDKDDGEAQAAVGASWELPANGPGLPPRESQEDEAARRSVLRSPGPSPPAGRARDGGDWREAAAAGERQSPRSPEPCKERLRFQFLEQKYGYYHCKDCNIRWESAYVWCVQGTNKVYFKQFCRTCQKSYNPYRVEDIACKSCKQTKCSCPVKLRHVDPKRPHRQDLCGRCKGKRLSCDSTFSFKYII
ncbi:zygote arrest protein 1 [Callithrix jacchus]|uniref:Zygote arrest 1 n=1 Tax=Callithrix jacchus TaxID=9483 RepID=F7I5W7_CALJA|nr:zygote arrest protein 1 [Callithrix jacchus]XP_035149622.1 zygote arrest protein 1 [Callithrix jacchus]XP_054109340.1 zygote arrest protein 1 [Callithrix jacchus]